MVRPTLINLNPVELRYCPFMISLDICTGSSNVLSSNICVPKETKDVNVKAYNIVTNKNKAKTMEKHITCDCKCKFNTTACNSNQKWNDKTCQCEWKNYHKCKKDYSWSPSTCIFNNSKYRKCIADTSVISCDENRSVMDIVSTTMTNTIATYASINFHTKKVKDLYFAYSFIGDDVTIDNYHYLLSLCTNTMKVENNEF